MTPVKAPFEPAQLSARIEDSARKAGFKVETFGAASGVPLLALTRRNPGVRPRIYLSAGIHGDEPAPPLALVRVIEDKILDGRANWFVCPLLNPEGFSRGVRENGSGIDLNRDYRSLAAPETRAHVGWLRSQPNFDLVICLHEDWEASGFYLYEQNPAHRPSLAGPMLTAVKKIGPIDPNSLIDGREAVEGVIRPTGDPWDREQWPESIYLRAHHTRLAYTIESPSGFELDRRVAMLGSALEASLSAFLT